MQLIDWDSWLTILSIKGYIFVEVVSDDQRFHFFKVFKTDINDVTNRNTLIELIVSKFPQVTSSNIHTKDTTPLLVIRESELLKLWPQTA